jgi:hypothetical protein
MVPTMTQSQSSEVCNSFANFLIKVGRERLSIFLHDARGQLLRFDTSRSLRLLPPMTVSSFTSCVVRAANTDPDVVASLTAAALGSREQADWRAMISLEFRARPRGRVVALITGISIQFLALFQRASPCEVGRQTRSGRRLFQFPCAAKQ